MSGARRRNPLGLSIVPPPTLNENDEAEPAAQEEASLDDEIQRLALTETQRARMISWFNEKRQISGLNEDMLEKICDLGHGNGGVVSKVQHKRSHTIMARKLVHVEVKAAVRNQIMKELDVLHRCNSPYIVGFYGAFLDQNQNDISICMEYMDGLSLDIVLKKVRRIEEKLIGRITVAVVRGLTYLKDELRILHRDVKPSNILVNTKGEIKLCDFGVSGMLIDSMANSFVGTRSYMAPERLTGTHYSVESDVWSFGLSLIELAVGRFPVPAVTRQEYAQLFNIPENEILLADGREAPSALNTPVTAASMSIFDLLEYIVSEPAPALPVGLFSNEFVDFVTNCTKKSENERANLKTLAAHPFYKKYDECDVEEKAVEEFATWVQQVMGIEGNHD
ncbi:hypothetical protein L596_015682 [Steinernema carpocapsae]|uniref:mitogen-activated protein kinase kinase n=1 Tax=Steinernema carpocapsae TaxID=34508 RepID=A0A4U5NGZ0_STECR|nr:hypothetical protein L596_015682 [Steinernema carpocapsae]